jgi:hypothetical protein
MAKKTCTKCELEKPLKEFSQYTEKGIKKHRARCKLCRSEDQKNRYKQNPDVHRAYLLKQKYGITLDDYDELIEKQGGKCAICGTDKPNGHHKRFVVDHNHETGEVRGLLCNNCNSALGYFQDNPDIIAKGFVYLHLNGYYGTI